MSPHDRPLADRLEVGAPWLAALGARGVGSLPEPLRERVLQAAFDRAQHAFNRGDLDVVFALFDGDVEYAPPPPLYDGPSLRGRAAVFEFWRDVFTRWDGNTIENLSLEETSRGRFVRRARLRHRRHDTSATLDYVIVQTTDLDAGRVVRQVNVLDPAAR
jgi:hypothetical protein